MLSYAQAEMDAMLMEYAGEGIPLVAAAVGGATFAPYFASFLPLLLNKTVSTLMFMTMYTSPAHFNCFPTLL